MLESLNEKIGDIFTNAETFNCGCQDWMITERDEKVKENSEEKAIHSCQKLIVWQRRGGITRYFRFL